MDQTMDTQMSQPDAQDIAKISRPAGLAWRCSVWFITTVVALGVATDTLIYTLIVPVVPFRLEELGYSSVSGLVGWLLFAYSSGLVAFTPPIAFLSERYSVRQAPLLCGQIALIGALIMMMEASRYWLMILARLLQGISSSVIWVAGLALLCDTAPEESVGTKLGIALSGLSIGALVGPPVAGALYDAFGYRAPFIFGIIITMLDLIGRLLIIERKQAILYGVDPAVSRSAASKPEEIQMQDLVVRPSDGAATLTQPSDKQEIQEIQREHEGPQDVQSAAAEAAPVENKIEIEDSAPAFAHRISLVGVLIKLFTSSRAIAVCISTLVYGMILTSEEPALPLYMNAVWGLDSAKVGLVYIAAVVPTLFSSTIAGWLVDKKGTGAIAVVSVLFSLPWVVLLIIKKALALFIVIFALANLGVSAIVSALTAELADVTKRLDGVGYAHVYGAFNLAYGVGSALGPIIGGQLYDHLRKGWMAICLFGMGIAVVAMSLAFCFFGDKPLLGQVLTRMKKRVNTSSA